MKGTAAGELVDGWLVVLLSAGGAGLKGGRFIVPFLHVVVVVGWCCSWTAPGRLGHGSFDHQQILPPILGGQIFGIPTWEAKLLVGSI